jgi:hypothetical protein
MGGGVYRREGEVLGLKNGLIGELGRDGGSIGISLFFGTG